jgi:ADP-ribose pyrophosphatase
MESKPQVISSVEQFNGRVFSVRTDEFAFEDGARARLDIVEHGGSYAVVALPEPNKIVLVRQYRHAVGRELWEIPAGAAENGEGIVNGALRELAEETGYRATSARHICTFYMTPGFCDEVMHIIVAENLQPGMQALDEDERIVVQTFTIEETDSLLASGEICDIKTLFALMWMRGNRSELAPSRADN